MKNKILKSKQEKVLFIKNKYPFVIDKSKDWGPDSLQNFPNGGWLKLNDKNEVLHGVQDIGDWSSLIGWEPDDNENYGYFKKSPIFLIKQLSLGKHKIQTLDGIINYEVKENSYLVCNMIKGLKDLNDIYIITKSELLKNYYIN